MTSIFAGTAGLFWLQAAAQSTDPSAVGTAPANAAGAASNSAILEMLHNSGPVALIVLGLLLITSLYSWAIILQKMNGFRKARTQSVRFLRAFRKTPRLEEVAAVSEQFRPSPLVTIFEETYAEYHRQAETHGRIHSVAALERTSQSAASEALTQLESRMTWLATIGAVAPFLGLFGTIWGIIDAFHGLGTAGAATLRAVAPGVSEALITTAAGLAVAVPAVVGYNQFTAQLREFASRLDDFCRELLNSIEESAALHGYTTAPEPARGPQQLPFAADPSRVGQAPAQPAGFESPGTPYVKASREHLPRY
jgi:biopolymer transport protein TolQ